ncbi:Trk system potassium transporter TrkA [Shewanella sp. WXL01]|uniref:Trk system potassium uptake protein TrkA n=1 Tax=Shewanella maritima TaxID=2520507 RepID=A0A411PHI0_9GAMM|nr:MULTISPECIES: Trk system potassium transporter TrkA [Shewanella]NKF51846.1 Trk system potassium transporter TrkA [Shewanella sp. WXL01]QBF83071.1 Trk system potassium transporter TrkA [Shewanella maritima]
MKIIILGAGQVGGTLAENLVGENNDITLVDSDRATLNILQDKFDLRVVAGHGAHPNVLKQAGAEDADMLIAVTNSDECNMAACQIAYSLYGTPTKIARIRSEPYLQMQDKLFIDSEVKQGDAKPRGGFIIDELIAPEQLVTTYIKRLVDYPGALQVLEFADGKLSLVAVKAYYGGPLVGNALATLREHMPNIDTRVAAIYRQGKHIMPRGTTIIEADDEVFFLADSRHIRAVMSEMQKLDNSYRNIMIAGGGNIGFGLAEQLQRQHSVKLIEHKKERADMLSEKLTKTTVFNGDASDQELLIEEGISQTDVFIAVTNDDEANIMSALLAKRMGAKKVMVLIQREAYVDIVQEANIDIAVSPQQATISALLTHIRQGDICNVYSLRRGVAEAIEAIAHGDENTSKVVGKRISDIKLPPGTTIGAIVRNDEVLMGHDKTVIEQGDHVILFLVHKKYITDVEKLFQPSAFFF